MEVKREAKQRWYRFLFIFQVGLSYILSYTKNKKVNRRVNYEHASIICRRYLEQACLALFPGLFMSQEAHYISCTLGESLGEVNHSQQNNALERKCFLSKESKLKKFIFL